MADHHQHCSSHDLKNERRLFWVMLLTGSFMVVEVIGGIVSGSLALLADAGHMLSDFGSLLLAFIAVRLARRPADGKRSFGYSRAQIMAAFINGLTLLAIAVWIVVEAISRLLEPVSITVGPMLLVATLGLIVNLAAFGILTRGESDNLNVRAAAMHVLGDLLGSVAAISAAMIIYFTGYTAADPILSVVVALLITRSAIGVIRRSGHILLEGTPAGVSLDAIRTGVRNLPGVSDIHHLHVWTLSGERALATLHVVAAEEDLDDVRARVVDYLNDVHDIWHPTVQMERVSCEDGER